MEDDGADSLFRVIGSPHRERKRDSEAVGEKIIIMFFEVIIDMSAEPSMLHLNSFAWPWLLTPN